MKENKNHPFVNNYLPFVFPFLVGINILDKLINLLVWISVNGEFNKLNTGWRVRLL